MKLPTLLMLGFAILFAKEENVNAIEMTEENFSMMEAKDTRRDVATARLKGLRRKNIKDIMFGDEDSTVHNPESSLNDTRRFIKTIWRQHADIPALSDALNIVHWSSKSTASQGDRRWMSAGSGPRTVSCWFMTSRNVARWNR